MYYMFDYNESTKTLIVEEILDKVIKLPIYESITILFGLDKDYINKNNMDLLRRLEKGDDELFKLLNANLTNVERFEGKVSMSGYGYKFTFSDVDDKFVSQTKMRISLYKGGN